MSNNLHSFSIILGVCHCSAIAQKTNIQRNFRPVSSLPFLSKVIEKDLAVRLLDRMTANNLMDPMQSAYRKGHSTGSALICVHNDIICAVNKGYGVSDYA